MVDLKSVVIFAHPNPTGQLHGGPVPLLQKDDVGHHFRPGVGLEGVLRQADGPQQVGPLRQILAHGGILGVHGVTAGDKDHDAAGTHLVQRFGEKVVVDVEAQLVIGRVVDVVLPEGDIAHSQIVKVPLIGCFKAVHGDVRFLVELSGNAPGEAVQLHAVQLGPGQGFRQEAEEVANAHRRFQQGPRLEIHILHRLIHGLDNGGAGVVGVEDRTAGGIVFLLGQQLLQLGILLDPLGIIFIKRPGNAAPAHIAG